MNLKYYATKHTLSMLSIPLIILIAVSMTSYALLTVAYPIPSQAMMATVDISVFWDITGTEAVTEIDWGVMQPGQNKTLTMYVKNTGSAPILGTINCSSFVPPAAENYMTLTWDFGVLPLQPGRIRKTNFTLHIASNITGIDNFYFLITVTGIQHII